MAQDAESPGMRSDAAAPDLDLALVMPVHSEEACIGDVVRAWRAVLSGLGIEHRMLILDDGSRDRTPRILAGFADDPRIRVITKANEGHGPTVTMGYRMAVESARWVFQCDGDDEMRAEDFPRLWRVREGCAAVFAHRVGREQGPARRLLSACAALLVRLVFGGGIRDVNVPYRLMRAPVLARVLRRIPDGAVAPNVMVAGALCRAGAPVREVPVAHRGRRTGASSLGGPALWRLAATAFVEVIHFALEGGRNHGEG